MNSTRASFETPRLEPIEQPDSWWMRFVYWMTERALGRVVTPVKVVYARVAGSAAVAQKMNATEAKLTIDPELRFLIKSYVAVLNGCTFCIDVAQANAKDKDVSIEKYDALLQYETSNVFSAGERAALAYVEEATHSTAVSEETFDELRTYFDDRAIAEITWLNAMENYYNLLNRPLNIGSDNLCALRSETDATPDRHAA
ncbi:carboxymuconolactone decarboxylase family protein [Longibacter sp.]|jgi:AhpD family alkylhydroperoxidase|uniref:carboxymuconolactone decarboxylase family protein n=1 Tax=Longibacter sp. TaxID=2045415 RepID=UPI003EB7CF43